jgi:hypothetical protein
LVERKEEEEQGRPGEMEEKGGDEEAPSLVLTYRNKRGRERECGGSSHGEDEEQRELASPVLGVNRRGQRWFLMGEDKGEAGLLLLPSKV